MQAGPTKINESRAADLVAALFTESHSAHGAIADLENAGFHEDRIAVAFSAAGKKALEEGSQKGHWGEQTVPTSEYSLPWKLRHWIETDLHTRGAEQLAQRRKSSELHKGDQFAHLDVRDALKPLGVADGRILLLDQILGRDGVLVLVDAGDFRREAEVILEKNSGQIRTATATEQRSSALDPLSAP